MDTLEWFPLVCVFVCVCPFLAFWISRAQWCPRLWQSAVAPLLPWNWRTSVCAHSTHAYKYDWHTITCSLNLKGWFYLALSNVVSCPNVGTSIKAEYTSNTSKIPSEIECAMEVTRLTTHALCISLHISFVLLWAFCLAYHAIYMFLLRSYVNCAFLFAWNCWLRHVAERGSSLPY